VDIEVLDAAYWMKGCSSLGRLRFGCVILAAVLLGVGKRLNDDGALCLMDIKEAVPALAPRQRSEVASRPASSVAKSNLSLPGQIGDRFYKPARPVLAGRQVRRGRARSL
jgi:uncharacterized protein (DUF2252 family)